MPPNIRGSPLSISITLIPLRGSDQIRTVTLKPGEPCLIGRASRSTLKNLEARHDNTLFDCPVISREHAELRAHLWDLVENQVTITDKGSMHGTRVNGMKLREGQPKTLRSGDSIQFGEKVTRGDSVFDSLNRILSSADPHLAGAHDGVLVTFDLRQNFTQESNTLAAHTPATNARSTYQYPSDDESDYGSEDNMSVVSELGEVKEVSSAKTTPEQAKAKPGSQEQPIELDQPEKAKRTLVQDSVDAQASVIVPESLPIAQRRTTYVDLESDDDSVIIKQNTPAPPRAMSYVSVDQGAEDQDEVEYPNNDDMEDVSDSEASELNHYSPVEESDEEDDEEEPHRLVSPEPAKERSPELRSSGSSHPFAQAATSNTYMPPLSMPISTSQSYVRPFRGEFNSNDRSQGFVASQPLSPSYPNTYGQYNTYAPFGGYSNGSRPLHNSSRFGADANFNNLTYPPLPTSSRWDKPPGFSRNEPAPMFSNPPAPSRVSRELYVPPGDPFAFSQPWNPAPSMDPSSTFSAAKGDYSPQSPKLTPAVTPAAAPATGRISIPDIVENEVEMENDVGDAFSINFEEQNAIMLKQAKAMVAEAKAMVQDHVADEAKTPFSAILGTASSASKRKADDAESVGVELGSGIGLHDMEGDETLDFASPTPAPKRTKTSDTTITPTFDGTLAAPPSTLASASNIAASVAKYAAVASAGGAGMLAFLCSPASEKLLTWLS